MIIRAEGVADRLIMDRDNFEYPIWLMLRQRNKYHPIASKPSPYRIRPIGRSAVHARMISGTKAPANAGDL